MKKPRVYRQDRQSSVVNAFMGHGDDLAFLLGHTSPAQHLQRDGWSDRTPEEADRLPTDDGDDTDPVRTCRRHLLASMIM